jgi:hypothetical protein
MADISCKSLWRSGRFFGMVLAGVACAAVSGCVILESGTLSTPPELPPEPVNEVLTIWDPSIRLVANSVNNGEPLPGLAGRIYLMNETVRRMVDARGSIWVVIRDTTNGASNGQYAVKCEFKELDLRRMKRTDKVGDGYTVFVPWETYRPDIKQIEVQVCYAPRGGSHHYGAPEKVTLRADSHVQIDRREQVVGLPAPPR